MFRTVRGTYHQGHIELDERPGDVPDDTLVIVTFLEKVKIDLSSHGITEPEAAELRTRLTPFAEDWNDPKMSVYDDYDAAKAAL